MTNEETIQALTTCRDHWKTSFEHERANVIRLRGIVAKLHDSLYMFDCLCEDCQLVRQHGAEQPPTPTVQALRDWISEVQRLAIQKYEFTPAKAAAIDWTAILAPYYAQNFTPADALQRYLSD